MQWDKNYRRALLVLVSAVFFSLGAWAQDEFRLEVESQFTVQTLRDGLLVTPLDRGVGGLEISDGEVSLDGEVLGERTLEVLLGVERSSLLRRLAEYSQEELEDLFREEGDEIEESFEAEPRVVEVTELPVLPELPELPEMPEIPDIPDIRELTESGRVSVGAAVVIEEDQVVEEAVSVGGPLVIAGTVLGDAVVVGSSAEVSGTVEGDLVSIGGSIYLEPTAVIEGVATSVGGKVHREDGAEVGSIQEVNLLGDWLGVLGDLDDLDLDWNDHEFSSTRSYVKTLSEFFRSFVLWVVLAIIGAVILAVFGDRRFRETSAVVAESPLRALGVGFFSALVFFPVLAVICVLLVVTLIGIPVVLILAPVAIVVFFAAAFFGYFTVGWQVGQWAKARFNWSWAPYLVLAAGLLLLQTGDLLGEFTDVIDGTADFLSLASGLFGFLGWMVQCLAVLVGLGGAIVYFMRGSSTPPPPPIPLSSEDSSGPTLWEEDPGHETGEHTTEENAWEEKEPWTEDAESPEEGPSDAEDAEFFQEEEPASPEPDDFFGTEASEAPANEEEEDLFSDSEVADEADGTDGPESEPDASEEEERETRG